MSKIDLKNIEQYIDGITTKYNSGHAKEHAYRPALERLMSSFDNVTAINDPKRSAHGNPDFVFLNKSNRDIILGYAEAKDIDISLDKTEKTDQMRRYGGYENLFLTNYLEFRFFQNGNKYQTVSIGEIKNGELRLNSAMYGQLADELAQFLALPPESIKSGKRLAQIMGAKARRIRDNVQLYLAHADDERNQELEKMYNMMKELLVHDLSTDQFADMYAQTLVYGLFVARFNDKTPKNFDRKEARDLVPSSNPFLREFFDHIVGPRFDKRLAYIVDELCEVFTVSDVNTLVSKHLKLFESVDEKDPIIHFYEDFLNEYDPAERKKMGAYYTPLPVVRFIVRHVDELLKSEFGLTKGLADSSKKKVTVSSQGKNFKTDLHRVQILDPAVGTATFLNEIVKYIFLSFKGQEGRWPGYVKTDLLPRIYGFELMMAPYTIAHLKLDMTLQETNANDFNQRLGVYLTNTLEEGIAEQPDLFSFGLAEVVSQEAHEAAKIKHERPIMVIVGNPPYSGISSNETDYANSLISKYKVEPGGKQKLQERKHWLNNDYVRFIAFAEEMIEKNGEGVVGMITDNSYLDAPTFRGMRWHLAKTFNKIYIFDLHGNSKKKESTPGGGKDENVFDITQGVAIIIAIKTGTKNRNQYAEVLHADSYGTRPKKMSSLSETPSWKPVTLDERMFYFVPTNTTGQNEYDKYLKLDELFILTNAGVVTARDSIVTDISKTDLISRMNHFSDSRYTDDEVRGFLFPGKRSDKYLPGDTRGWKLSEARKKVSNNVHEEELKLIDYRPFDTRWIYYSQDMVDWGRQDLVQNILSGPNYSLSFTRRIEQKRHFADAFIFENMIQHHSLSIKEVNYFAPLYLYHDDGTRTPNFKPEILKEFTKNLSKQFEPEQMLDYIYAVLYSPKYRQQFEEFLKSDFPRIPAPKNDDQFKKLSTIGAQLRDIHLMTSKLLNDYKTTYPVSGSDEVEKTRYDDQKVWINEKQYFGNVPKEAWNFYVGGYQPAQKWLKDRKSIKLTNEDIEHYQKIIKTLIETDKLMITIDKIEGTT